MKITWFGGTTVRIHIGGEMLVLDAGGAPPGVDRTELVSGADREFALSGEDLAAVDPASWRPRSIGRAIDETGLQTVEILSVGSSAVLVGAAGEPPLVLAAKGIGRAGRWSGDAVVVAFEGADAVGLLTALRPKLLALAVSSGVADSLIPQLRNRLDGTGLVVLEPGLALEV